MHLLVRETRSLDEAAAAVDFGHGPADIAVLSFSDADLGALAPFATAGTRLASLGKLRHPLSVDLYLSQTVAHARCVIIRLLGGLDYWRYGAEETAALCRAQGIKLTILPGDGGDDPALAALSTVAPADYRRLDAYFRNGGGANMARAMQLAAHLAGLAPDDAAGAEAMPQHGVQQLDLDDRPLAAIVVYRSHVLSADIAPTTALAAALNERGLAAGTIFAGSLKAPDTAGWIARTLAAWQPAVVLNATGFSARQDGASPLDAPGAPVLQLVLAGSSRAAWQASSRGLSPADLAMQVVLPELDGRLLTGAISFKRETGGRTVHEPDPEGIALAAERAAGWARLAATPRADRRVAIVLSDYPGVGGQRGHAVGLDSFASLAAIGGLLDDGGYAMASVDGLRDAAPTPFLSLQAYRGLLAGLPEALQRGVAAAWGAPEDDPAVTAGWFTACHLPAGHGVAALQPDRGSPLDRRASYHSPDEPPRHSYIAFYLWLRGRADAIVHLGTHGSLEWLPGKAAALSAECWPLALAGGDARDLPVHRQQPGGSGGGETPAGRRHDRAPDAAVARRRRARCGRGPGAADR